MKKYKKEKFNLDGTRDTKTGFHLSVIELCIVIDEYKRELKQAKQEIDRLKSQTLAKTMHVMRMVPQNDQIEGNLNG